MLVIVIDGASEMPKLSICENVELLFHQKGLECGSVIIKKSLIICVCFGAGPVPTGPFS